MKLLKDKKGILGLDTVKLVLVAVLVLGLMAIVFMLVLTQLRTAYESNEKLGSSTVNNETLTSMTGIYRAVAAQTNGSVRNCLFTSVYVMNATDGTTINATNYTTTTTDGCYIKSITSGAVNNTNWNVTYSYTYNTPQTFNIVSNMTSGYTTFFTNATTWLVLLGVVVLILIIAIVIVAVTRFQTGGGVMMKSGASESL